MKLTILAAGLGIACCSGAFAANEPLSEQDYFVELPVVLSVNRLSTPLDEAPAAVTVIDRAMILRSGVRTVTELAIATTPARQHSRSVPDSHGPAACRAGLPVLPNS